MPINMLFEVSFMIDTSNSNSGLSFPPRKCNQGQDRERFQNADRLAIGGSTSRIWLLSMKTGELLDLAVTKSKQEQCRCTANTKNQVPGVVEAKNMVANSVVYPAQG